MNVKVIHKNVNIIPVKDMRIGEIGEVVGNDSIWQNRVLLRDYAGLVDLRDPTCTWNAPQFISSSVEVSLLPKGDQVIITV